MTDYTELVKALWCCGNINTDCTVCPWDKYNFGMCAEKLYTDAADAIEELQKTIQDMTTRIEPYPIIGKAFDRAIEAWNEKAKMEVQDGQ